MKRNNLMVLVALILGAAFVLAIVIFKSNAPTFNQQSHRIPLEKLVKPYNASIGNPDSKVTVVEFLDPECGTCAAVSPMVKGLINSYKDQVRFVVRYMLFHKNSQPAAIATEAAGRQGKYWEMQAQLFFRREWAGQDTSQDKFFEKIAKDLGLDMQKFKQDLKDPEILNHILADYAEGPTLGVQGTPTFFINGVQQQSFEYEALKKAIDTELAK